MLKVYWKVRYHKQYEHIRSEITNPPLSRPLRVSGIIIDPVESSLSLV